MSTGHKEPAVTFQPAPYGVVLVTGATGFLGGELVHALLAAGRRVRVLTRSPVKAAPFTDAGAEVAVGDVMERATLAGAMRGVDVVYHCAGVNAFCLPDPAEMYRTNVDGSANVIAAAADAGVRRVVYTSSAATLGEATGTVGNEDSPHRGTYLSHYERSKHLAEKRVLQLAEQRGMDVVCVNPASVQGPGRTRGTAKLLLSYLNGKMPVLVDTTLSVVDIADCTRGHLLAEVHGASGQRYVLSGTAMPIREAVAMLERASGISRPMRMLPAWAATVMGAAVGAVGRVRKRRVSFCPEMVRTLLHGHTYDGSRATRELGLEYTPIEESVGRMVHWYREQGLIGSPSAG